MDFHLYNTLSGRKEIFRPIKPGKVGMYVCGPTVYDYDHLGHARTYLSFDLLNRFLRFLGNEVKYIQNITDVGHLVGDAETGQDKIQKKGREMDQTAGEVSRFFASAHKEDLRSLNIVTPDEFPLASDHIEEIIEFVSRLIEKGFAYVTDKGNVYFSVAKKPDYGKLSHRGLAEIVTGTRVESAPDKRSPADFALWKVAPLGAQELVWDSPWGKGFPGWHIECSVMSRKYLGDTFDIHGSGLEHIFPHHENEIAQTEALTGQPMANFWVHAGMLMVNGSKMGKSLHNVVTIREALGEYSANELRLAMYGSHYRRPFDYTRAALEQGVAWRKKIFLVLAGDLPEKSDQKVWQEIIEALSDDLDTPRALSVWAEGVSGLSMGDNTKLVDIFGLKIRKIEDDERAAALAKERAEARGRGDFLTADNRKTELAALGFEAVDSEKRTIYLGK